MAGREVQAAQRAAKYRWGGTLDQQTAFNSAHPSLISPSCDIVPRFGICSGVLQNLNATFVEMQPGHYKLNSITIKLNSKRQEKTATQTPRNMPFLPLANAKEKKHGHPRDTRFNPEGEAPEHHGMLKQFSRGLVRNWCTSHIGRGAAVAQDHNWTLLISQTIRLHPTFPAEKTKRDRKDNSKGFLTR